MCSILRYSVGVFLGMVAVSILASGQTSTTANPHVEKTNEPGKQGGETSSDASANEPSLRDEDELLKQGVSTFDPDVPAALETKRAPTGHLLVRPVINGERPGWFIFDTGAGVCVVSTPHVEGLHLRASGEIPATGVGGNQGAKLYRAELMQLGPMTLRDHPFMTTDLTFLKQFLGDDIAGVIGYGVLSRCVSEISIGSEKETPRVAVYDPATYSLDKMHAGAAEKGAAWSTMKILGRVPAIGGKVEDHEAWFRLDTGANGYVTLHAGAVEKWDMLAGRETTDAKLGGVGGFVRAKSGKLRSIEVGGVRREDVVATFALERKGSFANDKIDGNLGAELLRPFVLVLDYQRERAALLLKEAK